MSDERILSLTRGDYIDPSTGVAADVGVERVVIEDSLDGREAELIASLNLGDCVTVLSDKNTHAALGARVEAALAGSCRITSLVLDDPYADDETASRISRQLPLSTELLLAVGSGTINDLSKYVAHQRGLPYAAFATAPSMNGYTSVTASLTLEGNKTSVSCRPPRAAFFDLRVLSEAPARLIRAGVGDSVCRPTAQTDWLLSHLVLGTRYSATPFALLAEDETQLFAEAPGLLRGDLGAMAALTRTLVLSGLGMTLVGGSYPASQGEHLLSHYAESLFFPGPGGPLHGEKVGVATLVLADLQERLLSLSTAPRMVATTVTRDFFVSHFAEWGERYWENFQPKYLSAERADEFNDRLSTGWGEMRDQLRACSRPAEALRQVLESVGAATSHQELGWTDEQFRDACQYARLIRDRYTALDFAASAGIAVLNT